jgi:hypothetical protein
VSAARLASLFLNHWENQTKLQMLRAMEEIAPICFEPITNDKYPASSIENPSF